MEKRGGMDLICFRRSQLFFEWWIRTRTDGGKDDEIQGTVAWFGG